MRTILSLCALFLCLFCFCESMDPHRNKVCYRAMTCIHNGREKCGKDGKDNLRRFYDSCDLLEFNCLKGTDYTKTSLSKCNDLPPIDNISPNIIETQTNDNQDKDIDANNHGHDTSNFDEHATDNHAHDAKKSDESAIEDHTSPKNSEEPAIEGNITINTNEDLIEGEITINNEDAVLNQGTAPNKGLVEENIKINNEETVLNKEPVVEGHININTNEDLVEGEIKINDEKPGVEGNITVNERGDLEGELLLDDGIPANMTKLRRKTSLKKKY